MDLLTSISQDVRVKILELTYHAKTPHLGSALSCVDILVWLYFSVLSITPESPKCKRRDIFILSKGHAALALYVVLCKKGYFSQKILAQYGSKDSFLEEHPNLKIPGVEAATGSLGHGLSIGVGMALAAKIQQKSNHHYILMSDGECNEGSIWEAVLFAKTHELDNLTVIIDFNKWQATGRSCEVMALQPLVAKFKAFGWQVTEVDGHSFNALDDALSSNNAVAIKKQPKQGLPHIIIAHTTKGKGVSFMEDDNNWHYRVITEDELVKAKSALSKS